ncbi:hypothetical protein Hanom_Chr03g00214631 [Helianthus anomalus]
MTWCTTCRITLQMGFMTTHSLIKKESIGILYGIRQLLGLSKLQKLSFMLTLDCKVYPLSSKSTKNVLDVCKPQQIMSFIPNLVIFLLLSGCKMTYIPLLLNK